MLFIFSFIAIVLGFLALARISYATGKRAFSASSKIVIAFLKTAQLLFGECIISIAVITSIIFACSNHFVVDSYIVYLFSSMILIAYHILKMAKYPSVIS